MPSAQMTALVLEEKKILLKTNYGGFICNNEGHRQTQFIANGLCGEHSSIFSCTPLAFFFSSTQSPQTASSHDFRWY